MEVLPGVIYRLGGAPLVEPGRGRRLLFAFLTVEATNPKPTIPHNFPAPEASETPAETPDPLRDSSHRQRMVN